jgi:hypothetical protein
MLKKYINVVLTATYKYIFYCTTGCNSSNLRLRPAPKLHYCVIHKVPHYITSKTAHSFNSEHAMKAYEGVEVSTTILHLGTRQK